MKIHKLKSWTEFFEQIKTGAKKHDLRRSDDRSFSVGDTILLQEYDSINRCYTGNELEVKVTYITSDKNPCALSNEALNENFCILSISLIN